MNHKVIAIAVLAIVASGVFGVLFSYPISGPDSVQYDIIAQNLAAGRGFSLSTTAPFVPTMFREPVYPFFLAAIYRIFGHHIQAVLFIQMIIHSLTAILVYLLAKEAFSDRVALYSAVVVAVFPTLANLSACILSETLFTLMLCCAVYVFHLGLKTEKPLLYFLAGLLCGMLSLTKAVALFLPLFLIAAALCVTVAKRRLNAKLIFNILSFIMAFILLISLWSVRNKKLFDTYSLTVRSGEALWSRAAKLDDPPEKVLANACYNFSEFLGNKFFPDGTLRPERYLYRDLEKANALRIEHIREGCSEQQADDMLKRDAIARISNHPMKYLSYTFVEAIKMTAFTYLPLLNEPRVNDYFQGIKGGNITLIALKGMMRLMAPVLLFLFLLGLVKNFATWDRWILIFMTVTYFNVICSLLDAVGRFGVPLIPFYCIIAVAGFCTLQGYKGKIGA